MSRTAGEAGWRVSRYNAAARIPGTDKIAVANLYRGTAVACTPIEMYLLDEVGSLDENHPILKRFRERGLIVNFDELAALTAQARAECAFGDEVSLTICPTMGCNFDCPYCFENHRPGRMTRETQDDVIALAGRMLKRSGAKKLKVAWFGGEPLLMPDIIEELSGRLMALAEEQGAEYGATIITNGYLLTREIADMLGRNKVRMAQITLDGIGPEHDKTRHLAGGGSTYDRIIQNLRTIRLPFSVSIRHNVHAGNKGQIDPLRETVETLAKESGNDISYYASPVQESTVSQARDSRVSTLCDGDLCAVDIQKEVRYFQRGRGTYCGAHYLFGLGIDDHGRLYKCWEDVDKADRSFGTAGCWDPADPIATADAPDQLTKYLNSALPLEDAECTDCLWLPQCAGGCPNRRLYYGKQCFGGRNAPEQYVLKLYEQLRAEKNEQKKAFSQGHVPQP